MCQHYEGKPSHAEGEWEVDRLYTVLGGVAVQGPGGSSTVLSWKVTS